MATIAGFLDGLHRLPEIIIPDTAGLLEVRVEIHTHADRFLRRPLGNILPPPGVEDTIQTLVVIGLRVEPQPFFSDHVVAAWGLHAQPAARDLLPFPCLSVVAR